MAAAELVGEYVHQMNRQLLFELDTSVYMRDN